MRIRSKVPPPPRAIAHKRRNKTLPRKAKHKKPPAMGASQFYVLVCYILMYEAVLLFRKHPGAL